MIKGGIYLDTRGTRLCLEELWSHSKAQTATAFTIGQRTCTIGRQSTKCLILARKEPLSTQVPPSKSLHQGAGFSPGKNSRFVIMKSSLAEINASLAGLAKSLQVFSNQSKSLVEIAVTTSTGPFVTGSLPAAGRKE